MAREVNFRCRRCGRGLWLREDSAGRVVCGRCREAHDAGTDSALDPSGILARCAVCGCDHLYRQRDFNRKLGLAIVAVAAVLSVRTYGLSLLVAALIDLGLYLRLPEIVLCYHCGAIHRGFSRNPAIGAYDLATHERYENREWGTHSAADATTTTGDLDGVEGSDADDEAGSRGARRG